MKQFWGNDFGIIALAKNYPAEKIKIKISRDFLDKEIIQESDFWLPLIKNVTEKTKFGRIGIFYNRKNQEAINFCKELVNQKSNYQQKNPRAEKSVKFSLIKMSILHEMANEGLSNTVEFRRILRKYIREAKQLHLDSIIFLEGIFAEKQTRQILAKIAGTQIQTHFITDLTETFSSPVKKTFLIETDDDLNFTKKRAEQILQKKLKISDIIRS